MEKRITWGDTHRSNHLRKSLYKYQEQWNKYTELRNKKPYAVYTDRKPYTTPQFQGEYTTLKGAIARAVKLRFSTKNIIYIRVWDKETQTFSTFEPKDNENVLCVGET